MNGLNVTGASPSEVLIGIRRCPNRTLAKTPPSYSLDLYGGDMIEVIANRFKTNAY